MSGVTFRTELVKERNTVRLCVPADLAATLGTARLLPAIITIDGHPVRATLHKMGGTYMTAVNKAVQRQVGATAGDTVEVTVEPATEEPGVDVPGDLVAALAEAGAAEAFDRLTPFRRREMVKAVVSAKKPGTRARRVSQAVAGLLESPPE